MKLSTEANVNDIRSAPFINVGGGAIDIQSITLSNGTDGKDILKVFNAETGTYEDYIWFADLWSKGYGQDLGIPGWGNSYEIKEGSIEAGQGFWLKTSAANEVTVAGQVVAAEDNTFETEANMNDLCAFMYPTELNIQDIVLSNGTDGKDILKVFNAETGTYEDYIWFADLWSKGYGQDLGIPGWGNSYEIKEGTINPGQGFWLKTARSNTVTFKAPL